MTGNHQHILALIEQARQIDVETMKLIRRTYRRGRYVRWRHHRHVRHGYIDEVGFGGVSSFRIWLRSAASGKRVKVRGIFLIKNQEK